MNTLAIFIIVLLIAILWFIKNDKSFICPNCKKEYEKAERFGFTEYYQGIRCPHCKYEFDDLT